ncbi:MAG: hypothetical protein QW625_01930 [Candidatus Nanoarchaeia archaeon]
MEKPIKARLIVEIVGKPKEHVEETIILLGEKFAEGKKEVKILSRKVREPVQLKDTSLYSAFIEFEVQVENLSILLELIFDYLPSSIEIIEPEEISESNFNLNSVLNDLAGKLHSYDLAIKKLKAENVLLKKEIKKLKDSKINQNNSL